MNLLMHQQVLNNIAKHIQLDGEEAIYFTSLLHYKEIKRKDFLLKEGQLCRTISFVNSGALRAYYLDKTGKESTIMFAINDWWITDMFCFINRQPAMLNINAIEDSSVLELSKANLDKLYVKVPKFERFFRIIMQNAYIREQLRIVQNLSQTAEERYLNFLNKYPQIIPHITQKQLASYLGVSPEFLSAVRRRKNG